MCDDQGGRARLDPLDPLQHRGFAARIERRGRLIEDHQ